MKAARLFIFATLVLILSATVASAQTRTWVSGVGDDLNPCSRTAPCKTFSGAHSKTAKNGIIDVLDPGGFGAVTITKSLTIDGAPFLSGILASGTTGVSINITDFVADPLATVVLRNLDIEGGITGIRGVRVLSAKKVILENCRIFGFRGNPGIGVDVNTTVANVQVVIRNCTIDNNLAQGVRVSGAGAGATSLDVDSSAILHNGASAIDLIQNAKATVGSCQLSENGSAGVFAEAASTDADISYTKINHNIIGVSSLNGASVRLYNSTITHNSTSVSAAGVQSHGNNAVVNNTTNNLPTVLPAPALQ
ncbi:MAG TPA: right-handed parallel beta-helix repeat-containing protein [Thermoanaerobaculia bacterium]|nr:right-handed parallel beta-helix repeat-containing protein [Thermoanaerobaculia bacterium]